MTRATPDVGNARRASPWTESEARAALKAWGATGLTVNEYARQEGIHRERLYRWRRRLGVVGSIRKRRVPAKPNARARSRKPPPVIEIQSPRHAGQIEVVLGAGVTLRVAETIDPGTLARLVDAINRPGAW